MQPEIAARRPWNWIPGATDDEHLFAALAFRERRIGILLERDGLPTAETFIGSYDELQSASSMRF